jgi:hypothetical protein
VKVLEEFEHKRLILDGIMWGFTPFKRRDSWEMLIESRSIAF